MKRWVVFFVSVSVIILSLLTMHQGVEAENDLSSPWFSADLVAERAPDMPPPNQTPYNAPCEDTTSKTFTPGSWGSYTYGTMTECVYKADYGFLSSQRLKLNGTEMAYELRDSNGGNAYLYPIAHSNNGFRLMQTNGASSTHHLYIYDDIPGNLKVNKFLSLGRPSRYQLTNSTTDEANVIRNSQNQKVGIYAQTLGYSAGGRFMVADSGYSQNLINIQTKTTRQFGGSTYRSGGLTPNTKLVVDATGETVLVVDNEQRTQKLYNLKNCTPSTSSNTKEDCQSVDLTPILSQVNGPRQAYSKPRFVSKNTIELFSGKLVDGKAVYQRYFVHPENSQANTFEYLALGDSYTSGEGAYNYKYPTDTPDNRCHLSFDSYPYLIKKQLGLTTAESVACSGAKMKDIWFKNQEYYNEYENQAKGMTDDTYDSVILKDFLPGYRTQNNFIEPNNPSIITASIGGNDIGFGSKIQKCVLFPDDCFGEPEDRTRIFKEIRSQFDPLVQTYKKLLEGDENRKVYIVGYPSVAAENGDCGLNVHLSNNEIKLSNAIVTDLNTTIEHAAKKTGVRYVDVSDALSGHRLCEGPNWDLAMNGLTAGNDALPIIGHPLGKESYHPNNYGHQLYQKKILSESGNFTQDMPEADSSLTEASLTSVLDPSYSPNNGIPTPKYTESMSSSVVRPGETIEGNFNNTGLYFNQGDVFSVELHSTPQIIGEATASSLTGIALSAKIPSDIPIGLHTLHILIGDIEGKQTDLYRDIFVVPEGDSDGDGVPDDQDQCYFVAASGVDDDEDGLDDSCDSFIGQKPIETTVPEVDIIKDNNKTPNQDTSVPIHNPALTKTIDYNASSSINSPSAHQINSHQHERDQVVSVDTNLDENEDSATPGQRGANDVKGAKSINETTSKAQSVNKFAWLPRNALATALVGGLFGTGFLLVVSRMRRKNNV